MREKCDVLEKKITLLFKISYLVLAILTFNSFSFGMPIMSVLVMISFVLGSISLGLRLVNWKNYVRMPLFLLLVLFCLSFFISSVANAQYGFIENFKWIVWTSFQLFILYTMDVTCSQEHYKKEFKVLASIIIGYSFIAAVASIFLMVIQFQQIVELESGVVLRGFIWGRLWGVYTDPNYGAVISGISIILSMFMREFCGKNLKKFLCVNMIVQLLYAVFSDSRTGLVALLAGLSIYIYMRLLRRETKLDGIKKYIKNILIVLGVVILTFLGTQVIKQAYNNVVAPVLSEIFYDDTKDRVEDDEELTKIGREEDIKVDPSNRRFDIWKSGLEIFRTSPIVGTSYVSFIPYVEDNLPDTYVVNNDRGNFGNMHNEYINVLVYQGIIGAVLILLFMCRSIYFIFKNIFKLENQSYYYCCMLLTLVVIVASAMMFILEGVYTNSVGAVVLWSSLGYLMHFLKSKGMSGGMV